MTTNNEESRPRRSYHSANNERHASSNRNWSNDRRSSQDGYYSDRSSYNQDRPSYNQDRPSYNQDRQSYNSDRSSYNQDRSYHQERSSYNPNYNRDSRQDNYGGNGEGGMRKRRPRVGERPQSPQRVTGGGGYNNNRGWGNQPSAGPGRPGKPAKPVKKLKKKKPFKQVKYKENADPNAPIRLNKYLANAGVCSRREADEFIQAGVVKVNGEVVTELGTKITRADQVVFHNQPIQLESKVYVLLNKPKGFVTTTDDPENRKTVMELVKSAASERIYPVGRLDRATTGVLLLTNDGDLASKLTHPKYEKRKIYQVWLDKPVAMEHMQMIADGIELEDGEIHADAISYVSEEDLTQVGIEIHSGRNRIIRRIFEKLGYRVMKLDRVYFAGLTKKKLSRGKWRYLTEQEVNMLRMGAFD
ncbi:pseudouridine synthase [Proteiniphilum sp.]|uniref:pseudouridine synthase n=1 Tax=Proteiniphilum sp. TaxID=1926877 RepID=UPI002B1FF057|nr:pseudouridine synthase [Proteiniphilum sp.]MEA4918266.1 pseudouridine synthase [Proteiniphilum sp.]MEA4948713.1 pseudouridine synthase [Petrimonas sp.]